MSHWQLYVAAWVVMGWMVAVWSKVGFNARLSRKYPTLPPTRFSGDNFLVCCFCGPIIWPLILVHECITRIQARRYPTEPIL